MRACNSEPPNPARGTEAGSSSGPNRPIFKTKPRRKAGLSSSDTDDQTRESIRIDTGRGKSIRVSTVGATAR